MIKLFLILALVFAGNVNAEENNEQIASVAVPMGVSGGLATHSGGSNDDSFGGSGGSVENRDCAKYQGADAVAQTEEGDVNTFGATFSGIVSRRGTTNKDCSEPVNLPSRSGGSGAVPMGVSGGLATHSGGSND